MTSDEVTIWPPVSPVPVADDNTIKDLYRHRMLLAAALFNQWCAGRWVEHGTHKSRLHHDGTRPFGGGWFVVVATLPTGQISYHYPDDDWDRFRIPEHERADVWDGHTSEQAADRLDAYLVLTAAHEEHRA